MTTLIVLQLKHSDSPYPHNVLTQADAYWIQNNIKHAKCACSKL